MDPLKCYTFKEAIDHKTGFLRIPTQKYETLPDNIMSKGNLILECKNELKRVPRQTDHILDPPQGKKSTEVYDSMRYKISKI